MDVHGDAESRNCAGQYCLRGRILVRIGTKTLGTRRPIKPIPTSTLPGHSAGTIVEIDRALDKPTDQPGRLSSMLAWVVLQRAISWRAIPVYNRGGKLLWVWFDELLKIFELRPEEFGDLRSRGVA